MKYSLIIYEGPSGFAKRTDPKHAPGYWAGWQAYSKALQDAKVLVGGAGLEVPSSGTTVRVRGGKRVVNDGPFADTKEQLGGFFNIDVPNLDAALEWAARVPVDESGVVEVRPHLQMMP